MPWCRDLFNPKANYLHRITALHFIYFCCTAHDNSCPTQFIIDEFTPYFMEALQDQVPNVRILAIRYVMELLKGENPPWDLKTVENLFSPHFKAMAQDLNQDREIIYQGGEALKLLKALASK